MSLLLLRKAFDFYRRYGLRQTIVRIVAPNLLAGGLPEAGVNLSHYSYKEDFNDSAINQEIDSFSYKPLVSIIMPVYNIDPKWLDLAIKSLEKQFYKNWELCIADDCSTNSATINHLKSLKSKSIKVTFLTENSGIAHASNAAANLANGDYLGLLDNDDELTRDAIFEVVKKINEEGAEFIYSDEDLIDESGRSFNPHFKTDYNHDLLLCHNYITHFSVIKKDIFEAVSGFNSLYDGAQDYDLFLKVVEKTTKIAHIPKVLYHWRTLPTSTSINPSSKKYACRAGKLALEAAMDRRGISAIVKYATSSFFYDVIRKVNDEPLVSIIVPFKDEPLLLERCLESILSLTGYQNFEIIGVSNNSTDPVTFEVMESLKGTDKRIRFIEYNVPFNYSKINNYAVREFAKGEHILLLNNDVEVINGDWLKALVEHSIRPEVGAVGGKLFYPNGSIQHAGVLIGIGYGEDKVAGHAHKCFAHQSQGYFNRLFTTQNFSALTAACLMVKKSLYNELSGLNEDNLAVAFNDVDFCLRLREKGLLNVFTPHCRAYHHESVSRGPEDTKEKVERLSGETQYILTRHAQALAAGDPYYNPNLTQKREDFSLAIND